MKSKLEGMRLSVIEDGLNQDQMISIKGGESCRTFGACAMQKCTGYKDCEWGMGRFKCGSYKWDDFTVDSVADSGY